MPRYVTDDENRSALPAWVCKQDAAERSAEAESLYSEDEQDYGVRLRFQVEVAYFRSTVYMEFRKKFISISVYKPTQLDSVSADVERLDRYCEENGIEKVRTKGRNFVYRVPKDILPDLAGKKLAGLEG